MLVPILLEADEQRWCLRGEGGDIKSYLQQVKADLYLSFTFRLSTWEVKLHEVTSVYSLLSFSGIRQFRHAPSSL